MSNVFQHLAGELMAKIAVHHQAATDSKAVPSILRSPEQIADAARRELLTHHLHISAGVPVLETLTQIVEDVVSANPQIALAEVHKFVAAKVPSIVTAVEGFLPQPIRFMAQECSGTVDAFVVHYADVCVDRLYAKAVSKAAALAAKAEAQVASPAQRAPAALPADAPAPAEVAEPAH